MTDDLMAKDLEWLGNQKQFVDRRFGSNTAVEAYNARIDRIINAARAEGLRPPVGDGDFSSLGTSKAPACGSPTDCQTSGGEA